MTERWPALPYDDWRDTCDTLHMWTQMAGKVKLELSPFLNEYWNVAFPLTARGMTSGIISYGDGVFELRFDFIDHTLSLETSDGSVKTIPLLPRTVADFYDDFKGMLEAARITVKINPRPSEVPDPIPFNRDRLHSSYEPDSVTRWWQIQLQTDRVLERYRSSFVGKSSPVHFFWGGFDLSHARFSGRPAPPLQGVPRFLRVAEDQENFACGFWPGNTTLQGVTLGEPAFYAYIYPEPDGFKEAPVRPDAAHYDTNFGEFILPYGAVRQAAEPENELLAFFQTAYEAAATLAYWDRDALERQVQP